MSRNVDLLNQAEAELKILPNRLNGRNIADSPEAAAHYTEQHDGFEQALLSLAQNVFLSNHDNTPHVVVLCGVEIDSGSSEICMQLGRILATYNDKPVCLIDADLRSLRLSELLAGSRSAPTAVSTRKNCDLAGHNLWLARNQLLDPQRQRVLAPAHEVKRHLVELRNSFEFVLIDAPGVNTAADAVVLAQIADAAILVIEANSTRKAAALRARKALGADNVRLLGTVLNNRSFPIPEQLYKKL